jgi:hypothetical protein
MFRSTIRWPAVPPIKTITYVTFFTPNIVVRKSYGNPSHSLLAGTANGAPLSVVRVTPSTSRTHQRTPSGGLEGQSAQPNGQHRYCSKRGRFTKSQEHIGTPCEFGTVLDAAPTREHYLCVPLWFPIDIPGWTTGRRIHRRSNSARGTPMRG